MNVSGKKDRNNGNIGSLGNTLGNTDNQEAANPIKDVKIVRWHGGQHPTYRTITQKMEQEGLRPYAWSNGPNFRYTARSHGYSKVLYCVEGSIEVVLPDANQSVVLRPGDRMELPRGVRHAAIIGPRGAQCVESPKQ
jgi:mannose-6-phosphate isomerase-like protein (cupin superfamily)